MLDADTKRRIDTARDILVGKVPDPKSQVEQITIALIYKFMDDMDAQSEELGGKRDFFVDGFARYGWAKLMRSGLGGHETLDLYAEAIIRMPENPGVPQLFRDIFKNALLPYRDPETLRSFLKIIDEFTYDHPERLGDAFEYLLSVLGSQGDAGQFRTPRHIIDFMVEIVDPKKDEKILDPACGTAGFLISAYKHILKANTDENGGSALTSEEQTRLAANLKGYDISPDMVRLSLANMYLHGFTDPHISEYDTLTSEDNWNEFADVILANPPFMSPKGGIRPHNRFSVNSKRSEVLFVDYMAGHLGPAGRAGIIVPEGIIFQSQNAYKQLRKMLVEDYLVAVVSLPAGVFNPYAGVKTSVLILDKPLARRTNHVGFFKIENDGFDLGAQRREIDKNDLPQAKAEIAEYLRRLRTGEPLDDFEPTLGLIVEKEKIAENGEYNLSGERYRESDARQTDWPMRELGKVCSLYQPKTISQKELVEDGEYAVFGANGIIGHYNQYNHENPEVLITCRGATCGTINMSEPKSWITGNAMVATPKSSQISKKFLYVILKDSDLKATISGSAQPQITRQGLSPFQIPLPPLDIQKEIVAEIEGYQKVIDGARAVVDNYRPHIAVDPEWPMVVLGDICDINPETVNPALEYPNTTVFYVDISSVENETGRFLGYSEIASSDVPSRARRGIRNDDVLLSTVRPNLKAFTLLKNVRSRAVASTGFAVLRACSGVADPAFILASLRSEHAISQMVGMMERGAYPSINQSDVVSIKFPLPPLETQQAIVAEIEAEQALVDANRELMNRFEKKIEAVIARVWGEDA